MKMTLFRKADGQTKQTRIEYTDIKQFARAAEVAKYKHLLEHDKNDNLTHKLSPGAARGVLDGLVMSGDKDAKELKNAIEIYDRKELFFKVSEIFAIETVVSIITLAALQQAKDLGIFNLFDTVKRYVEGHQNAPLAFAIMGMIAATTVGVIKQVKARKNFMDVFLAVAPKIENLIKQLETEHAIPLMPEKSRHDRVN
ncbi:MAG: hypothetical protein Q7S22_03890 [Candidatus Micrarchaeota archaeon]|nr:hypothetical protein [Candidatus Micrarchaeota archaeon]